MHMNANDSLHVGICLLGLKILEYTGKIDTMYIIWLDMMQLFLFRHAGARIFSFGDLWKHFVFNIRATLAQFQKF